jgi:hypothetical protein
VVSVASCDGCDVPGRGPDGFLVIVDRYLAVDEVTLHDLDAAAFGPLRYRE